MCSNSGNFQNFSVNSSSLRGQQPALAPQELLSASISTPAAANSYSANLLKEIALDVVVSLSQPHILDHDLELDNDLELGEEASSSSLKVPEALIEALATYFKTLSPSELAAVRNYYTLELSLDSTAIKKANSAGSFQSILESVDRIVQFSSDFILRRDTIALDSFQKQLERGLEYLNLDTLEHFVSGPGFFKILLSRHDFYLAMFRETCFWSGECHPGQWGNKSQRAFAEMLKSSFESLEDVPIHPQFLSLFAIDLPKEFALDFPNEDERDVRELHSKSDQLKEMLVVSGIAQIAFPEEARIWKEQNRTPLITFQEQLEKSFNFNDRLKAFSRAAKNPAFLKQFLTLPSKEISAFYQELLREGKTLGLLGLPEPVRTDLASFIRTKAAKMESVPDDLGLRRILGANLENPLRPLELATRLVAAGIYGNGFISDTDMSLLAQKISPYLANHEGCQTLHVSKDPHVAKLRMAIFQSGGLNFEQLGPKAYAAFRKYVRHNLATIDSIEPDLELAKILGLTSRDPRRESLRVDDSAWKIARHCIELGFFSAVAEPEYKISPQKRAGLGFLLQKRVVGPEQFELNRKIILSSRFPQLDALNDKEKFHRASKAVKRLLDLPASASKKQVAARLIELGIVRS
jgi:hypothetical protein